MALTVLITGFGPFPGAPFNPTAALAKRLARRRRPALSGTDRIAHVFPTSYAAVERELPDLIDRHRPDLVLLFGLAPRTPHLRIEARARNRRSTLFADVDGMHPSLAIRAGGPVTLVARARQQPLRIAARTARVPARLSTDAGKYLCNFAYWRALELTRSHAGLVQFVHVPNASRAGARMRSSGNKRPNARLPRSAAVPIPLQPRWKAESRQLVNGPIVAWMERCEAARNPGRRSRIARRCAPLHPGYTRANRIQRLCLIPVQRRWPGT